MSTTKTATISYTVACSRVMPKNSCCQNVWQCMSEQEFWHHSFYVVVFSPGPQNFAPLYLPFMYEALFGHHHVSSTGSSQELLGYLKVQVAAFLHLNLGFWGEVENLWAFSSYYDTVVVCSWQLNLVLVHPNLKSQSTGIINVSCHICQAWERKQQAMEFLPASSSSVLENNRRKCHYIGLVGL